MITYLGTGNTIANRTLIAEALTDMFVRLSSPHRAGHGHHKLRGVIHGSAQIRGGGFPARGRTGLRPVRALSGA
ncbi:hypothetical protein [Komagataeibacter europaeus]|uniref:hypothetical protein n=1 Tax=Komagataeibacter europaeus TaxID=33995 RepID=UPI000B3E50FD|nr:hypothetical protein [Komagataeibacter europaeus]